MKVQETEFHFINGFIPNGAAVIREKITAACADGSRCVTVPGSYEIETPIRPPSDFTLILNNCHLRMADGACTLPENNASVDITPFWKP